MLWHEIRSYSLLVLGWILVLVGIIITPLPVPFGLMLVGVGLYLLTRESKVMRRQVARMRHSSPGFSSVLRYVGRRVPILRRMVSVTEPGLVLKAAQRRAAMLNPSKLRRALRLKRRVTAQQGQPAE